MSHSRPHCCKESNLGFPLKEKKRRGRVFVEKQRKQCSKEGVCVSAIPRCKFAPSSSFFGGVSVHMHARLSPSALAQGQQACDTVHVALFAGADLATHESAYFIVPWRLCLGLQIGQSVNPRLDR